MRSKAQKEIAQLKKEVARLAELNAQVVAVKNEVLTRFEGMTRELQCAAIEKRKLNDIIEHERNLRRAALSCLDNAKIKAEARQASSGECALALVFGIAAATKHLEQ